MLIEQDRNLVDTLRRLGFSDLEALVYLDLLRNPSSTGYRIGRSISKPHANVYQSLVALEQKGAVLFEDGETRIYSAVAPAELIGQLRKRYERECSAAEVALKALEVKPRDEDRFFRLTSRDQVYARGRAMVAEAKETVLVELFPACAEEMRDELGQAVGRGLVVAGLVMRDEDLIEGSRMIASNTSSRVSSVWPGDQLTIIVDAREFLLALFDRDTGEVKRATSVSSPYIATLFNNGIVADVLMHKLHTLEEIGSANELIYGKLPPGVRDLFEFNGGNETPEHP
jgi:sugar-specific transcriptional regulator TrmB